MPELFPAFMKQGFDDVDFLYSSGGVTPSDCAALGVQAHGLRRKLCSVASLRAFTVQGAMEKWHATVMAAQAHAAALATGAEAHRQLEALRAQALRATAAAEAEAAAKKAKEIPPQWINKSSNGMPMIAVNTRGNSIRDRRNAVRDARILPRLRAIANV